MSRPIESDPIRWMRDLVAKWLGDDRADPGLLVRWLQGYGLPPVGHDEEPYLWLLRGIPPGADRDSVEAAFANRVGKLLDEKPDETRPGERPDQLLYNLYHLCAGLQRPDELGERLYAVFTRGQLKGEWRGVDLRYTLLGALISNQMDARLLPVWEAMLEGRRDGFLAGSQFDGFQGVMRMPPSAERRERPAWNAIGEALDCMVTALESEADRDTRYQSVVESLRQTRPGERWDLQLYAQATKNRWPEWTLSHIPGPHTASVVEAVRKSPFRSPSARAGVINQVLTQIELGTRADDPAAETMVALRRETAKSLVAGGGH